MKSPRFTLTGFVLLLLSLGLLFSGLALRIADARLTPLETALAECCPPAEFQEGEISKP